MGCIKSLQAVLSKERPVAMAVAFDSGRSFRHWLSQEFHEQQDALAAAAAAAAAAPAHSKAATAAPAPMALTPLAEAVRHVRAAAAEAAEDQADSSVLLDELQATDAAALWAALQDNGEAVAQLVQQLLEQEEASRVAPLSTYKAGRPTLPSDFKVDLDNFVQLLAALGVPTLAAPLFEADDIIATLTARAVRDGYRVKILSGDKDMYQLVDDKAGVSVLYMGGGNRPGGFSATGFAELDEAAIIAKMGVAASQVVDYKALAGDASDSLPGVRGVGEKTATALLLQYHDLDGVYAHLQELRPRQRELLEIGRASAYHTRVMAQTRQDAVPVERSTEEDLTLRGYDEGEVGRLISRLELKTLAKGARGAANLYRALGGPRDSSANVTAPPLSSLEPVVAPTSPTSEGVSASPTGAPSADPSALLDSLPGSTTAARPVAALPGLVVSTAATAATLQAALHQCRADLAQQTSGVGLALHLEWSAASVNAVVEPKKRAPRSKAALASAAAAAAAAAAAEAPAQRDSSGSRSSSISGGGPSACSMPPLPQVARIVLAWQTSGGSTAADGGTGQAARGAAAPCCLRVVDVPLGGAGWTFAPSPLGAVLHELEGVLGDSSVPKAAHDIKAWHRLCFQAGIELRGAHMDTLIASYLLNPDGGGQGAETAASTADSSTEAATGLATRVRWRQDAVARRTQLLPQEELAAAVDGLRQTSVAGNVGAAASGSNSSSSSSGSTVLEGSSLPAASLAAIVQLWQLAGAVQEELAHASQAMRKLLYEVELPVQRVLAGMELAGVAMRRDALVQLQADIAEESAQIMQQCTDMVGAAINLRSPRQLEVLLFDDLGLKCTTKTAGNKRSTSVAVLEPLRDAHPIVPLILRFREVDKLGGTYVGPFLAALDVNGTGRVHTTYDGAGTTTGRLSSHDPNMQNLPNHGRGPSTGAQHGHALRRAFVPQAGWTLLAFDYSQIELRMAAHLSGEPRLVAAFLAGADLHRATAAAVLDKAPDQVTSTERQLGKVINFGVLYGEGAKALARRTNETMAKATAFLKRYEDQHPHLFDFLEQQHRMAVSQGYVETLLGRRRYFSFFGARLRALRDQAVDWDRSGLPRLRTLVYSGPTVGDRDAKSLREASNMPMQGSCADILKAAMVAVSRLLAERGLRSRMLLSIHDELVLEVPPEERDVVAAEVAACMENAVGKLRVPLVVDVSEGPNLFDLTDTPRS